MRSSLEGHLQICTKEDIFKGVNASHCLEIFNLKNVENEVVEEWLQVVGFQPKQVTVAQLVPVSMSVFRTCTRVVSIESGNTKEDD